MHPRARCFAFYLQLMFAMLLSGCLPLPAPTKTTAPPEIKKIDLSFLHPGSTTRRETEQKLGWSDSRINSVSAFVGRWSQSSSGTIWGIGGSEGVGPGGIARNWNVKTLLVEFGKNDVVSSFRFVPDRHLVREFQAIAEKDSRSIPEKPIQLSISHRHQLGGGERWPADLILTKRSLRFAERSGHDFEIEWQKVLRFEIPKIFSSDPQIPDEIRFTIYFSEKTKAGEKITLFGAPSDLMSLISYQVHARTSQK